MGSNFLLKEYQMNKARLLRLADFLAKLKESDSKEFDMGTWGRAELIQTQEAEPLEIDPASCGCKIEKKEVFECRTTACALGWATQIPSFQKAGLKMNWGGTLTGVDDSVDGAPSYKDMEDINEIGKQFFGLTEDETSFLFTGAGDHNTPKETAKAIRTLVKRGLEAARGW